MDLMGMGFGMGVGVFFFWVFVIVGAIIVLMYLAQFATFRGRSDSDDLLAILEKRFAVGEITKDQLEEMKKVLDA